MQHSPMGALREPGREDECLPTHKGCHTSCSRRSGTFQMQCRREHGPRYIEQVGDLVRSKVEGLARISPHHEADEQAAPCRRKQARLGGPEHTVGGATGGLECGSGTTERATCFVHVYK